MDTGCLHCEIYGRQLVAVGFSYTIYLRVGLFQGYFVVSPHVVFATDVTHFCHSLRLSSAPHF